MNKGDAAYLWSAQFSLPHRPPHQHSHIGSSQLCLSSLQTTKHMIHYKKKYEQTWEKKDILILVLQLRQALQSFSGNAMFYLRGAPYSAVQREGMKMRNEGIRGRRKQSILFDGSS